MCGIVAYCGKNQALPVLLEGLKSLEYRGYDSAGVAIVGPAKVETDKQVGKIATLADSIGEGARFTGSLGIAHTRWATHGGVTQPNAHPHSDCTGQIWLAHNGIVENYQLLKQALLDKGHQFTSETDTEVLVHLIEAARQDPDVPLEEAVRQALAQVTGTYGLVVIDQREPDKLIAARNFSPLCLGLGKDEYIIASDPSAILKYTRDILYLEDGEMAIIEKDRYRIVDVDNNLVQRAPQAIDWSVEEAQKQGYDHFMLKEIFEQPEAIRNSTRGRLILDEGLAKLGGLEGFEDQLAEAKRLIITACGTAMLAGRVGEYMLEEYAGIPVEVDLASEFRYRKPVFQEGDVLLALSQSGETADTLASLQEAKRKNILTLGVVNAVGSSIARTTDAGVYQHIGPEIGVASTKAFTSQVTIMALLTLHFGRARELSLTMGKRISSAITQLPEQIEEVLESSTKIEQLVERFPDFDHCYFLGRKYNFPVALEGALKLKEVSYIHAEGYSAGELKHGPIALIDQSMPSIIIAPQDSVYEKTFSNIQEVKARGGKVIVVTTAGNTDMESVADETIYIPKTLEMLTPVLAVIPLQLLAYYAGVKRGLDVDKPRNLAKSVTVE